MPGVPCETVKTGSKNRWVKEATHVLRRKLGKIEFLELFQKLSVHEFYRLKELITLVQVNTTEWSKKKKRRIFFSKTAMVGCCKLSLNANVSCDEHLVEIYLHSHLVSLVFLNSNFI